MGLLKLIIAALVIGAIGVIVNEIRKARNKEKLVSDLYEELDEINAGMDRAEVKNDVIAARELLAKKRAEIADREAGSWYVEKEADAPITEGKTKGGNGAVKKQKASATRPTTPPAPKKKVAKKKASPKKKAPAKKK